MGDAGDMVDALLLRPCEELLVELKLPLRSFKSDAEMRGCDEVDSASAVSSTSVLLQGEHVR